MNALKIKYQLFKINHLLNLIIFNIFGKNNMIIDELENDGKIEV